MRILLGAALVAAATPLPSPAFAGPGAPSFGQSFSCTPIAVWDGDGPIWCAEGPKVRLAGIAAREIDGRCRPHHPCPKASGEDARTALVRLVGRPVGRRATGHVLVQGPTLRCRSVGNGRGDRTAAWCVSPRSGNLSCALVAGGHVLKWPRYWDPRACARAALRS